MGKIGNVFTDYDRIIIAAGFTGIAGDILQALYGDDRTFSAPDFTRNTRAAF
jgi:hypothetical protein